MPHPPHPILEALDAGQFAFDYAHLLGKPFVECQRAYTAAVQQRPVVTQLPPGPATAVGPAVSASCPACQGSPDPCLLCKPASFEPRRLGLLVRVARLLQNAPNQYLSIVDRRISEAEEILGDMDDNWDDTANDVDDGASHA